MATPIQRAQKKFETTNMTVIEEQSIEHTIRMQRANLTDRETERETMNFKSVRGTVTSDTEK